MGGVPCLACPKGISGVCIIPMMTCPTPACPAPASPLTNVRRQTARLSRWRVSPSFGSVLRGPSPAQSSSHVPRRHQEPKAELTANDASPCERPRPIAALLLSIIRLSTSPSWISTQAACTDMLCSRPTTYQRVRGEHRPASRISRCLTDAVSPSASCNLT